jgi:E3 ubiquitin-protein ligase DOA10
VRKLLKDVKAITPVLSNVLLMLIAVAGMSIAITATYVITDNLHDIMGERFIVENVWFTTGKIAIYLRNTGKVPLSIAAIYVNYTSQSFTALTLEVEGHGWLNVTYSWSANTVYHINVVTSRGTQVVDYYRSPT